jgi:hypothetical protein
MKNILYLILIIPTICFSQYKTVNKNSLEINKNITVDSTITSLSFNTSAFKLTTSPSSGYVLVSDASGNGTWNIPTAVSNASSGNYTPTITGASGAVFSINQVYWSKVGNIVTLKWIANFTGWTSFDVLYYVYLQLPYFVNSNEMISEYFSLESNQNICVFYDYTNNGNSRQASVGSPSSSNTIEINLGGVIYEADTYYVSYTYSYISQ